MKIKTCEHTNQEILF